MNRKRIRHIPDVTRIGWTYCGRGWLMFDGTTRLPIIDLRTDSIEDAECRACQRSDDRRTREIHRREEATPPEDSDKTGAAILNAIRDEVRGTPDDMTNEELHALVHRKH